jgi:hypothetical protein
MKIEGTAGHQGRIEPRHRIAQHDPAVACCLVCHHEVCAVPSTRDRVVPEGSNTSVNHWLTKAFCRGSNFVHVNGIFADFRRGRRAQTESMFR